MTVQSLGEVVAKRHPAFRLLCRITRQPQEKGEVLLNREHLRKAAILAFHSYLELLTTHYFFSCPHIDCNKALSFVISEFL